MQNQCVILRMFVLFRWNAGSTKRLTLEEAVHLLVRNRSLSEDQAEVVLSRSLVPAGDGKFK